MESGEAPAVFGADRAGQRKLISLPWRPLGMWAVPQMSFFVFFSAFKDI